MKKNTNNTAVLLKVLGLLSLFAFSACSMPLDGDYSSGTSSGLRNISFMLTDSVIKTRGFMGGSVVYNPSDLSVSQLSNGVVVALRFGKINRIDAGNNQYVYADDEDDAVFGYINVSDVNNDSISFDYYEFEYDEKNAVKKSSFVLRNGDFADINSDGYNDVVYRPAPTVRPGSEKSMWLTFINDPNEYFYSTMFSVLPQQYARSVYPGGIIGVNTEGRYIVNKYDIGTSNRAAVKSIIYGDYVIDLVDSTVGMYVGNDSTKNARVIEENDIKVIEPSVDDDPELYVYKNQEFTGEYSINALLKALPSSMVKGDIDSMSISEGVELLNNLIKSNSFIYDIIKENPGEAANKIMSEISGADFSSDLMKIITNRCALSEIFPNLAPKVNLISNSLCVIFPYYSENLGELIDEKEKENVRSVVKTTVENHSKSLSELEKELSDLVAKRNETEIKYNELKKKDAEIDSLTQKLADLKNKKRCVDNIKQIQAELQQIVGNGSRAVVEEDYRAINSFNNNTNPPAISTRYLVLLNDLKIAQKYQGYDFASEISAIEKQIKDFNNKNPDIKNEISRLGKEVKHLGELIYIAETRVNEKKAVKETENVVKEISDPDKEAPGWIQYQAERAAILSVFEKLYSFNLLPTLAAMTNVQQIVDIVDGTNAAIKVGVGGSFTVTNYNPRIDLTLCVLVQAELEDELEVSINEVSLFTKDDDKIVLEDGIGATQKESGLSEADFEKKLSEQTAKMKKDVGIDKFFMGFNQDGEAVSANVSVSDCAKTFHKAIPLGSVFPIVATFDAKFDILFSCLVVGQFQDCFVGGLAVYGYKLSCGVDWGFRKKVLGVPVPWTFYANPYSHFDSIAKAAGYAGFKKQDISGVRIGAGIKLQIVPVLELGAGVGIGASVASVSADIGISFPVTIFLPISTTNGLVFDTNFKPLLFNEFEVDFGARFDLVARANLDPPLVNPLQFTWPLMKLGEYNKEILKVRYENFKKVD